MEKIFFFWNISKLFSIHTAKNTLNIFKKSLGKNVTIFGADMSSSAHIDNKGKDNLILGKGPTQGLDDTTLLPKAKYPVNFTQSGKRFVLSLHYNGKNSFLFANARKIYQFKAKHSEMKD